MNKDILEAKIVDLEAVIEFTDVNRFSSYFGFRYGTPEYWKRLEKEYLDEIRQFEEFIRDHRSRDSYNISVNKKYIFVCKFCGHEFPDEYDGLIDCCDKALDLQKDYIKLLSENINNE